MTYIYGLNPVRELIRRRAEEIEEILTCRKDQSLEELFQLAGGKDLKIKLTSRHQLDQLVQTKEHQGIIARAPLPEPVLFEELLEKAERAQTALLLFLDQIEDPQNLGAIFRSAEGAGALGVVMPKRHSAPITPAVHKASAGAIEWIDFAQVSNLSRALEQAKRAGYWIYGAFPQAKELLWEIEFSPKVGIVIGSEGKGIRPLVARQCDFQVRIPLFGKISSLNASVSCALLVYEFRRQKGF